jgi:hypothetical protein
MDTPQIPVDPNLATEQQQAQNDMVSSLQTKTQGDMSSLMARYGTQLAIAGTGAGAASNNTGGILSSTFGKAA